MANCCIGFADKVADATVAAGSALSGLPASNLQTFHTGIKWRSDNVDSTYVVVDFGASVTLGWTALAGLNLTAAGTLRVRASTADATGAAGDAFDSGAPAALFDPDYENFVFLFPTDIACRYLRIDLADSSLAYLEAGRWWAGTLLRPLRNYAFNGQDLVEDQSKTTTAESGDEWSEERPTRRGLQITLPALTEAEKVGYVVPLQRLSGTTRDVLLCKDSGSSNLGRDSVIGRLTSLDPLQNVATGRWSVRLTAYQRA
jgi:hypothetical protein